MLQAFQIKYSTHKLLLFGSLLLIAGATNGCLGDGSARALRALKHMEAKNYFDAPNQILFAEAIARGDEKQMTKLIQEGADVNAVGRQEMRPLFWAMSKQSLNGFKFLLEHGADPNVNCDNTNSSSVVPRVMGFVAIMENPEYLKLALKHGGNANCLKGGGSTRTIIYEAIMNKRIENVRILIEAGADMNYQDAMRYTPMIQAADLWQYQTVYILLVAGADPTIKDQWGYDVVWTVNKDKDRGLDPKSDEYGWYLKVVEELRRRNLLN